MCFSVNASCKKIKITLFDIFVKTKKTSTAKYNTKSVTCVTCVQYVEGIRPLQFNNEITFFSWSQVFWNLAQRQSIWSLTWWKTVFFCLRFHREILNIFAELLCCPGPVSGQNNNNVIIHKFDRQATYKLLLHLQSHSGIRFQKYKSTWEPSIVKQNITYNNWVMVGKTTRAADLGWKCGEKKWTIWGANKEDKILIFFSNKMQAQ